MEAMVVMEAVVVMKAGVMMEAATESAAMKAAAVESAAKPAAVPPTGRSWRRQRERQHDHKREADCPSKHWAPPNFEVTGV